MPLELRLTVTEKTQIVSGFAEGLSLGELAKELGRDLTKREVLYGKYLNQTNT